MRTFLALALMILVSNNCVSQVLEGEWKGFYRAQSDDHPIKLTFSYEKDNTYAIKSYSDLWDGTKTTTVVCKVDYRIVGTDSIYLAETAELPPHIVNTCPQQMFLRIRLDKKKMILEGDWQSKQCNMEGTIRFTKEE